MERPTDEQIQDLRDMATAPDGRPDTARLRQLAAAFYNNANRRPIVNAADWIDAQPVRGDGPDLEELRALSDAATGGAWSSTETAQVTTDRDWIAETARSADAPFIAAAVNYVRALLAAAPPATSGEPGLTTNSIASNCGGPLAPTSCPLLVDLAAWVDAGEDDTDPIHAHLWEPNDGPGHPGCGSCQLAVLRFRDNPATT